MLFVFGMLSLALGACKKNDPVTPTPDPKTKPAPKPAPTPDQPKPSPEEPKPTPENPQPTPEQPKPQPAPEPPAPQPAPEAHFNQPEVSVRIGKSVSATLENFTGTLTQVGQEEGFTASIKQNVVTITADAYRPGKHVFTFKGGDKSYQLTVNLENLPDIKESYAVYDLDTKKPILDAKYHRNSSANGVITISLYANKENAASEFIQFSISQVTEKILNFSITCAGLKPLVGSDPYLPGPWHNGLKGIVIKKPNDQSTILSFVSTVAEGKQIYVIMDTKK